MCNSSSQESTEEYSGTPKNENQNDVLRVPPSGNMCLSLLETKQNKQKTEQLLVNVKNSSHKLITFVSFSAKELMAVLLSWILGLKAKEKFRYLKQQVIFLSPNLTITEEMPLEALNV